MSYLAIKIGAWFISGLAAFTLLWDASKPPAQKLQPGVQITTTLISIVPTMPTTSTTTIAPIKGVHNMWLTQLRLAGQQIKHQRWHA